MADTARVQASPSVVSTSGIVTALPPTVCFGAARTVTSFGSHRPVAADSAFPDLFGAVDGVVDGAVEGEAEVDVLGEGVPVGDAGAAAVTARSEGWSSPPKEPTRATSPPTRSTARPTTRPRRNQYTRGGNGPRGRVTGLGLLTGAP
ncbi:hypothetical protein GCM10011519_19180 [Marmoricola endophyticus]|uniref:Uncharacterized protein n=1 Tax=Marmoricola endophyticus TaxID=2040280 RepID=A0A917BI00_9ACTN|nr:hypothetical protein GCM10011519_19180 [Marmoricola endophyticus]